MIERPSQASATAVDQSKSQEQPDRGGDGDSWRIARSSLLAGGLLDTGVKHAIMESMILRRDFGKPALAAVRRGSGPNSVFGGVQVGINARTAFTISGTAEDILNYMVQLNLSAAELRLQPVEAYQGAHAVGGPPPRDAAAAADGAAEGRAGRGGPGAGRVAFATMTASPSCKNTRTRAC
jgi:hypothetical protein